MEIKTVDEYEEHEKKLESINDMLSKMLQEDTISVSNVIKLRDEAKEIAFALKAFLKQTFITKDN